MIDPNSRRCSSSLAPRRLALIVLVAGMTAGSVSAKDLPRRQRDEPKPADAACAYLGEDYVRVAGSDTCIRVSGHVRADSAVIWGR